MSKNKKSMNLKTKNESDDEDEISSQEDNIDTDDIIDTIEDEDEDEDDEDEVDDEEDKDEEDKEGDDEKNACLIDKTIEEDNIFFDTYLNSDIQPEKEGEELLKENRISTNRLTKYEMVRILGERTKQLKMGAKPLIKNYQDLTYEKIAEEELKVNMIPFKVKRQLPSGKYEIWQLDELSKEHLMSYLE